jgi:hypothetical protein
MIDTVCENSTLASFSSPLPRAKATNVAVPMEIRTEKPESELTKGSAILTEVRAVSPAPQARKIPSTTVYRENSSMAATEGST